LFSSLSAIGGFSLLAIAAVVIGFLWVQEGDGREAKDRKDGMTPVKVVSASKATFFDSIEALGTARAREAIEITSKVSERVANITFQDSSFVKTGDVLVELTSAEEGAALQEARATLQASEQEYTRSAELAKQGNAPGSRLEGARAGRDVARAKLNAMQARLNDRIVRAPFDGIVGLRMVSPGQFIQPGQLITTLDDVSLIKADFPVPERFLSLLAPDLDIEVGTSAYPDEIFRGKIVAVDSRINERTRAITVRAEIPNEDAKLRPGMLLVVSIQTAKESKLAIPENAIVPLGTASFVYRLNADNKVERLPVKTGRRTGGIVEIVEGLSEGDVVVTDGVHLLRPGQNVKIITDAGGDGKPVARENRDAQPPRGTKNANRT
jgi:membrane fusion protein (multidrug efflux system)